MLHAVEAHSRLTLLGIWAVTFKAPVREDRLDIAPEINLCPLRFSARRSRSDSEADRDQQDPSPDAPPRSITEGSPAGAWRPFILVSLLHRDAFCTPTTRRSLLLTGTSICLTNPGWICGNGLLEGTNVTRTRSRMASQANWRSAYRCELAMLSRRLDCCVFSIFSRQGHGRV